jgi:hypothetical protein
MKTVLQNEGEVIKGAIGPYGNFTKPRDCTYLTNVSFGIGVNLASLEEASEPHIVAAATEIIIGNICPGIAWTYPEVKERLFKNQVPSYTLSQRADEGFRNILSDVKEDMGKGHYGGRRYVVPFCRVKDLGNLSPRPCCLAWQLVLLNKPERIRTFWIFRSFDPTTWMSYDLKVGVAIHEYFNEQLGLIGGTLEVSAAFFHCFKEKEAE